MRATKKISQKTQLEKYFLSLEMNLFFFGMFFFLSQVDWFFYEIGNKLMRELGRKKHMFFFGNAQLKSNARAHLKEIKKT